MGVVGVAKAVAKLAERALVGSMHAEWNRRRVIAPFGRAGHADRRSVGPHLIVRAYLMHEQAINGCHSHGLQYYA